MGQADLRLLAGIIFGQLGTRSDTLTAYRELENDEAFQRPISYANIDTRCCFCLVAMLKACAVFRKSGGTEQGTGVFYAK